MESIPKSKWGYHSCDYATYRKLKELTKLYFKTLSAVASWRRWDRKEPHNRVIRPKIRNGDGDVIGYGTSEPMGEPTFESVFAKKEEKTGLFHPRYGYKAKVGWTWMEAVLNDLGPKVLAAYRMARKPVATPEEVQKLPISAAEIESLCERAGYAAV